MCPHVRYERSKQTIPSVLRDGLRVRSRGDRPLAGGWLESRIVVGVSNDTPIEGCQLGWGSRVVWGLWVVASVVSLFRSQENERTCQAETIGFRCLDAENIPKQGRRDQLPLEYRSHLFEGEYPDSCRFLRGQLL